MEFGALRLLKPVSLAGIPYYLMQSVFFCYVIFSLDLSLNNQRTRFKSEKPAKPPICCVMFLTYYLTQSVFRCYVIFSVDLSLDNQRTRFKSEKPAKPPICCVTFFTYKLIIIVIIINHHYQSNCQQFYPRKMGISFLIYQPSDQRRSFYDLDWDKTRLFLSCFDSQTFETRVFGLV